MERTMRAKVKLNSVNDLGHSQVLTFNAVAAKSYGTGGVDENNTFARYTPSAEFKMTVTNPALFGKLKVGKEYYVDFTEAPIE